MHAKARGGVITSKSTDMLANQKPEERRKLSIAGKTTTMVQHEKNHMWTDK